MTVFYEEDRRHLFVRRGTFMIIAASAIGFLLAAFLIALALWSGLLDWGPNWRLNEVTVGFVGATGLFVSAVFAYLFVSEGLSVQRAAITDTFILPGKAPRFFKRYSKQSRIDVNRIRRMDLRRGIPTQTLPFFRRVRLWLVRLALDDGSEIEFRTFDPGLVDPGAWLGWIALAEILRTRGVEVHMGESPSEVP